VARPNPPFVMHRWYRRISIYPQDVALGHRALAQDVVAWGTCVHTNGRVLPARY